MIVYGVRVVSADGRLIMSENFHPSADSLSDLSCHIRSFGSYHIILVTSILNTLEDAINNLGSRFMKDHGQKLMDRLEIVDEKDITSFRKTIYEIISQEKVIEENEELKPVKTLTTADIFELPHHLQSTALAIISLEEGTVETIAQESNDDIDNTLKKVTALVEMGYLGKKQINGKMLYYCSI